MTLANPRPHPCAAIQLEGHEPTRCCDPIVFPDERSHGEDGGTLFALRSPSGPGCARGEDGPRVHVAGNLLGHAGVIRGKCSAVGNDGMGLQFLLAGKFDPPPVTAVVAVRPRHACRARDEDAPENLVPASHWPSSIRRQRDHRPAVQRLKGEIRKSPFEIPPGTAGVPWPDGGSGYGDAAFSGIRTGSDTRYHPGRASLPWLDRPGTAGVPWPDGRTDAPGPCETVTSASARTHQPWQGKPAVA